MAQKITTPLADWDDADALQDGAVAQAVRALNAWIQTIGTGAESNPLQGYAPVPAIAAASQDWVVPWRDALLPETASPGPVGIGGAPQADGPGFVAPLFDISADALSTRALERTASSPPPIGGAPSNQ